MASAISHFPFIAVLEAKNRRGRKRKKWNWHHITPANEGRQRPIHHRLPFIKMGIGSRSSKKKRIPALQSSTHPAATKGEKFNQVRSRREEQNSASSSSSAFSHFQPLTTTTIDKWPRTNFLNDDGGLLLRPPIPTFFTSALTLIHMQSENGSVAMMRRMETRAKSRAQQPGPSGSAAIKKDKRKSLP